MTTSVSSTAAEKTKDVTDQKTNADKDSDSQAADTITFDTDSTLDSVEVNDDLLKYNFDGLKTEKYINILKNGHYKMIVPIDEDQIDTSEEIYIDVSQNKYLSKIGDPDADFKILSAESKSYYIYDNTYCITDDTDSISDIDMIFSNLGYVESGEKEINGATYYYDEYYDTLSDASLKIYVDNQDKIYCVEEPEFNTIIYELSDEFDNSVFNVLDGCTEVSEDEFMNYFTDLSEDISPAE